MDSLAAQLMRRSRSGLDTTGALTQPPVPRLRETDWIKPPYGPDPLVFGPQYEQDGMQLPVVHCPACGAGWSIYAGAECWHCGKEGR